jgi:hypothetical protein
MRKREAAVRSGDGNVEKTKDREQGIEETREQGNQGMRVKETRKSGLYSIRVPWVKNIAVREIASLQSEAQ